MFYVIWTASKIASYLLRTVSEVSLIIFLQSKVLEAESRNEQMAEEKNTYTELLEKERANSMKNETRVLV